MIKQLSKKSIFISVAVSIPLLLLLIVFVRAHSKLLNKNELQNFKNAAASVVLSDEGKLLGKIFTENRTNISFHQIPDHLIDALIATEDVRFRDHRGVDTRSMLRVFFKTILLNKKNSGGGSTITQQLAKNLFGRNIKGPFALLVIKTREIIMARRIEKVFTKEEIITLYLNTVPFGENVFGIESACQRYFNTKVELLAIEESAVLVGMLKANSVYNPRLYPENARSRRNVVLVQLLKYNYLKGSEADSLMKLPLKLDYSNLETEGPADYFIYQVRKEAEQILHVIDSATGVHWNIEEDGLVINTTLNLDLQKAANQAFFQHLSIMQKRLDDQYKKGAGKRFINDLVEKELDLRKLSDRADEIGIKRLFSWSGSTSDSISIADSIRHNIQLLHAGLIAIDPVTGSVKAWAGGIDFKTQPFDQVTARRQMGSVLKPILFAAALEAGISPCQYLDNDSMTFEGYGNWTPGNFDRTLGGKYSLTGALVHSMNIPTLNLFLKTGFGVLDSLWKKMGFSFGLVNTPSLAMGTAEASILECAVAYAVFSNGGFNIVPQKILSIVSPDGKLIWENKSPSMYARILTERTCKLINEMLQKAIMEGTGNSLRSVYSVEIPLAGKTGTSQDYTDAWFASYNPSLVIISRVGASLPSVHFNSSAYGTGSTLALPIVGLTLREVQKDIRLRKKFSTDFPSPDPELEAELNCPDYREGDFLDNFFDIFSRDRISYDTIDDKPNRRKRSFFRKIFRPNNF
jgi:penicillin-binding protein 1A